MRRELLGGEYCRVRLDRALATASWSAMFPFATVEHLTAAKSDHSPILLVNELEANNLRVALKKPFRYECMWETDSTFGAKVQQVWNQTQPATTVAELAAKLTSVGSSLKSWGRESFGSVRQKLRKLRHQLAELRAESLRVGPREEEKRVQDQIVELSFREEIMIRQRSQINWLSAGDQNTQYFQRKASGRRAKNTVSQLQKPDGSVASDLGELAEMINDFYKNLYTTEGCIGIEEVLSHIPARVDAGMNAS